VLDTRCMARPRNISARLLGRLSRASGSSTRFERTPASSTVLGPSHPSRDVEPPWRTPLDMSRRGLLILVKPQNPVLEGRRTLASATAAHQVRRRRHTSVGKLLILLGGRLVSLIAPYAALESGGRACRRLLAEGIFAVRGALGGPEAFLVVRGRHQDPKG